MSEPGGKDKIKVVVRSSGVPAGQRRAPGGAERRRDGRVEMSGSVNVVYDTFREFISANAANVSRGGMFIPTADVKPVGSRLSFVLSLKDEFTLVRGRGEVVWARPQVGPDGEPAGIAIRFLDIDETSLELIGRMVKQHQREGGVPFDLESAPPDRRSDAAVDERAAIGTGAPAPDSPGTSAPPPVLEPAQERAAPTGRVPGDGSRVAPPPASSGARPAPGLGSSPAAPDEDPAATVFAGRAPSFGAPASAPSEPAGEPGGEQLPALEPTVAPGTGDLRFEVTPPPAAAPEPEAPAREWDAVWVYGEGGDVEVRPGRRRSRLVLLVVLLVVVGGGAAAYVSGLVELPGVPRWGQRGTTGAPPATAVGQGDPGAPAGQADEEPGVVAKAGTVGVGGTTGEEAGTAAPPTGEAPPAADDASAEGAVTGAPPPGQLGEVRPTEASAEPAGPTRELRPGTVVERISWRDDRGMTLVTVEVDGPMEVARVISSRLDTPPRQLVRLIGIEAAPEEHVIEIGGPRLERIRSWLHGTRRPPELHVVLDLSGSAVPVSEPVVTGSRVELLIGGPPGR